MKKQIKQSVAPSLFDLDTIETKNIIIHKEVKHIDKVISKSGIVYVGINEDYEKYGYIALLKNKLI